MHATWTEELAVGVTVIDDQHKRFIGFINALDTELAGEEMYVVVSEVLEGLTSYVHYHFGTEEKYFELFQYPDAPEHVVQHRRLTNRLATYRDEFINKRADIIEPLRNFLWEWLQAHIKLDDKAYAECFHKNGLV